jgi:hypothetical protein
MHQKEYVSLVVRIVKYVPIRILVLSATLVSTTLMVLVSMLATQNIMLIVRIPASLALRIVLSVTQVPLVWIAQLVFFTSDRVFKTALLGSLKQTALVCNAAQSALLALTQRLAHLAQLVPIFIMIHAFQIVHLAPTQTQEYAHLAHQIVPTAQTVRLAPPATLAIILIMDIVFRYAPPATSLMLKIALHAQTHAPLAPQPQLV